MRKLIWGVLAIAIVSTTAVSLHAQLEKILKGGAVVLLVKQFGRQINDGINTALMNRKWEHKQATKVVPIFSIGTGAYVGAAQVIGDEEEVNKVDAVAQIELSLPGKTRARVLIPVDKVSLNVTEIQRIYGVGVSAVIDVRL